MNSASRLATVENGDGSQDDETDLQGSVLVVDDEPHLVGMYASMLDDLHTVRTATSGEDALEMLSNAIDVVLLDRRMPEVSGDELLEIIREEGYDCRVAMVTSVDPGEDIFDMAFDAYCVKPVRQRDLQELVQNLLLRSEYSDGVRELLQVTSKLVALESQYAEEELEKHDKYLELRERKETLEDANDDRHESLIESGDTGLVYRDVLGSILES